MNFIELYQFFLKWSWSSVSCIRGFKNISFPCKSLCLQVTADVTKFTKNAQRDLTFILIELGENINSFVQRNLAAVEKKNVAYLRETCFFLKLRCLRMRSCVEIFHLLNVNVYV